MTDPEAKALSLARYYVAMRRWEQALDVLTQLSPDQPQGWALRGMCLYQLDRNNEARRALQAGLELEPQSCELLHLLALVEDEAGDLAAAERAILSALHLEPESPELLCTYASFVAKAGQFQKAERLLQAAGQIDPDEIEVVMQLAHLRRLQGRDRESERLAREVLARDPEEDRAKALLALQSVELGRMGAADRSARELAREHFGVQEVVDFARETRFYTHPLMWPLYPVQRLGGITTWVLGVGTLVTLDVLGFPVAALTFGLLYLALVVYSWLAPPLLRRFLMKR